jgi:uncharacterized membrane protein
MSWIQVLRWLHVLTAAAWFGQVVVLNFVLVPAIVREKKAATQLDLMRRLLPPSFKLASILSGLSVVAGGVLLWGRYHEDWSVMFSAWQGHVLATGALLAVLLTGFHHMSEPKLGRMIQQTSADDPAAVAKIVGRLKIAPKVGLVLITLVTLAMMIGVRGI